MPEGSRSNAMLMAAGLASVIRNDPPIIEDGQVIVGCNYGDGAYEYISTLPAVVRDQLRQGLFSDEEIDWYFAYATEAASFFTVSPRQTN